ncbi:SDR family NAD(P)-dependent oxidoreductase [Microbacterium sp. ARD32]|uniref:SDR family NAD(P)-dependent oxidoreductase n=1 Tax=Microbacterium sp. ARD32 TaxID=2962577 RepID=UPI0028826F54|nr:SDR family NAD(P)-dependent oxidoreductase [Microbacterium sp. ARD32]MDT0157612.1 SDR family NAD(P)-dependent oxidoreductase [Microbacterium sp. ARD32]
MSWNPHHLPDLHGRTYAITGSTAGIGYFASEQLAAAGADVILAGRSPEKLARASAAIRTHVHDASVGTVELDLASLSSVSSAADALSDRGRLDGLFLNGGSMGTNTSTLTADGLPIMLGTHVVAGFALATRLLPVLDGRIVHASSGFVRRLRMEVDDVRAPQRGFFRTYTQAKTVTELFAYELERRLRQDGHPAASLVAHPGVGVDARTPARKGVYDPRTQRRRNPFSPWAQGKDAAAWSAVRALTDPGASGGEYYGPENGRRGLPVRLEPLAHTASADRDRVTRVWQQLERLAAPVLAGGRGGM